MSKEQYGSEGFEIGLYGKSLMDYLSPEHEQPSDTVAWTAADYDGFNDFQELQILELKLPIAPTVDWGDRFHLNIAFREYNMALPYNEGERRWLLSKFLAARHYGYDRIDSVELVKSLDDRMMMSGVRRVVHGRDLMRRWIAWRRQVDEFSGQDGPFMARITLESIIGQVGGNLRQT